MTSDEGSSVMLISSHTRGTAASSYCQCCYLCRFYERVAIFIYLRDSQSQIYLQSYKLTSMPQEPIMKHTLVVPLSETSVRRIALVRARRSNLASRATWAPCFDSDVDRQHDIALHSWQSGTNSTSQANVLSSTCFRVIT